MLLCYSTKVFNQYNEVTCFLHLSTQLTDGFRKKKKKKYTGAKNCSWGIKKPTKQTLPVFGVGT